MIGKTNSSGVMPTGTITLSANGTYNITNYSEAVVSVSGGSTEPTAVELANKTISRFYAPSMSYIEKYTFYDCKQLSECILSSNMMDIPDYAFLQCFSLKELSCLSTGTLVRIGINAFYCCDKISTPLVMNPTRNWSIHANAFFQCSLLSKVSLYTSYIGNTYINSCAFQSCGITDLYVDAPYVGMQEAVFLGNPIPFIDTSINFKPRNVASEEGNPYVIAASTFAYCSVMSYVNIENSIYHRINACCFQNCYSLKSVYISYLDFLGERAFYSCSSLEIISGTFSLSYLNRQTFSGCYNLKSFSFSSISQTASAVFYGCSSLKYVSLTGTSLIGSSCFYLCSNLSFINIINAGTISSAAFQHCYSLTSLMFTSSSFRFVGSSQFMNCSNLISLYMLTTTVATLAYTNTFNFSPLSINPMTSLVGSIYVRQSLLDSYKTATNWIQFSNKIVGLTDEEVAQVVANYNAVPYVPEE